MCLRFRLSFQRTWPDGRSWLSRTLWNSAMRRVRLLTWEGMSPRRGRVPLTQHLSDHTCSMHTWFQFCVHTSPQYKGDGDKTEQVQHKAPTMSGSGSSALEEKEASWGPGSGSSVVLGGRRLNWALYSNIHKVTVSWKSVSLIQLLFAIMKCSFSLQC